MATGNSLWFAGLEAAPPIEVFALTQSFTEDTHEKKVNLGVGAYRTEESKPWVLPVVRQAEVQLAQNTSLNHEYLPVAGLPEYRAAASRLLLGEDSPAIVEKRVDAIQAIGGTGSLRIGLDLLISRLKCDTVYVSTPTWGNHKGIAKSLRYPSIREYRYWDAKNCCIDFAGWMEDLRNAPERSVILLHAAAHNPTGMDPSQDQWKEIAKIIREKKLFPFFDCAYQGFSSGDLAKDAWSVRYFVQEGFEILAAQSFSKNFGLYNERVGQLLFVTKTAEDLPKIRSQLVMIVRETWSNPPAHGALVVSTVLNNPQLYAEWRESVRTMAERILKMRQLLYEKLTALNTPGTWEHIVKQTGMFSYTGLNAAQAEYLIKEKHIYLLRDGRINMCGVTTANSDYVASSIHEAVTKVSA